MPPVGTGAPAMPHLGRGGRSEQRSSLLGDVRSVMAPQTDELGVHGERWEGSKCQLPSMRRVLRFRV